MSEEQRPAPLDYHVPGRADRTTLFDRRNARHADCIMWGTIVGTLGFPVLELLSGANVLAALGWAIGGSFRGGCAGIAIGFGVRAFVR